MAASTENLDIASSSFKANAHQTYARLREKQSVWRVKPPLGSRPAWMVLGYDDVAALLKDARFAKDRANALTVAELREGPRAPKFIEPLMRGMLDRDDPDHARLRRLVHKAFTSQRVAALESSTLATCERLVDRIERSGRFDLIAEYAMPVPVTVISDLLGVPPRDRNKFARRSKTIIKNSATPWGLLASLPDLLAMVRYQRWLVAEKRAHPGDDLVSDLVKAEEDGDKLDSDELLSMIGLLLTAGHETTTNLIGNGLLALLEHPDALRQLRDDPELTESAVEELLRFASPVETSTFRYAREDLELAGTTIRRGELVLGVIASANRDPSQFNDPDALDLARTPNRHLSFGLGGHFCLGAPLARLEGRIAFSALLRRLPRFGLEHPDRPPRWRRGMVFRGLESLPMTVT
ncbi:MAG TPA: cytochrome P450 [Gemmatimonadales bacterium]|nr:cytochrome P450 [Gemmatimonadales bacterium]